MCFTKIKTFKKNRKTQSFVLTHQPCMWPTFATRKGAGFKLLNSPGSGPQRAGKKNAPPGAKETWETLKEMGLVVGQVLVRMSKVNQHCVDVHRFSLSPVGFDPHLCQVDSESGTAPTVQLAHPTCKLSQGRHWNPPHLHVQGLNRSQIFPTHMQSASEFCVHSNSLSLRTSR